MHTKRLTTQLFILATAVNLVLTFSLNERGSRANDQVVTAAPAPVVTGVDINGKVLTVFGERFSEGARVLINGEPQKTRYDSSSQLTAKKAGKKLNAGDNLQVQNPDGTRSAAFLYNKAPYEVPVAANDIVYSPRNERLYACVGNRDVRYPNSIAIIDPLTTQVEETISVGSNPLKPAFSSDYQFLYVVVDFESRVQRVNLRKNRVDLEFSLDAGFGVSDCFYATDIRVMPGHPETIAVAAKCNQYAPYPVVAIFDDGVRRPSIATGDSNGDKLCFGATGDMLWGYDSFDTSFAFSQFHVDTQGVSLIGKAAEGVLFGANQKLEFSDGLLYTTNGRAVYPERQIFDGRFLARETLTARTFAVDSYAGRVYFGQREGFDFTLLQFDLQTYRLTAAYKGYYGLISDLTQMVRCGSAGLALVVPPFNNRIVIFPLSLLKPIATYERPEPAPINGAVRRIPLPNYEITYDAKRQLFYACVPSLIGGYGNCIVKIDPVAGTVGDPVWAGSEPWQMAVTDDGQYLYSVLFGGRAVRRLRLPDLAFDLRFPLFNDGTFYSGPMSTTAGDIVTIPGHPESLIVARSGDHNHGMYDSDGVAVYDNGVKRPDSTGARINGNAPSIGTIQLSGSGAAVYGLTTDGTDVTFTKMGLDNNGVRINASNGIGDIFVNKMRCQNGLCFTNTGLIIDPETQTRVAKINLELAKPPMPGSASLVAPDVPNNRIYYIGALGASALADRGVHVLAYDLATRTQVASFRVLNVEAGIGSFWLWGNDQIAFSTGDEIVFFPKSLLQPVAPH